MNHDLKGLIKNGMIGTTDFPVIFVASLVNQSDMF